MRRRRGEKLKFQHGLTRITGSKQLKHPVLFFDVEITRIHSNPNFEAFKESHGKEQNGICTYCAHKLPNEVSAEIRRIRRPKIRFPKNRQKYDSSKIRQSKIRRN